MKTKESRFHIHDELTAPEGSLPILKGALSTGGQLSNFLGVLAGSPAALRAYARFRSELRHGTLTLPTLERIALAVADHYDSEPGRRPLYHRLVADGTLPAGIACDDGAAAHFADDELAELIADRPGASAYRVEPGITETRLETRFLGA